MQLVLFISLSPGLSCFSFSLLLPYFCPHFFSFLSRACLDFPMFMRELTLPFFFGSWLSLYLLSSFFSSLLRQGRSIDSTQATISIRSIERKTRVSHGLFLLSFFFSCLVAELSIFLFFSRLLSVGMRLSVWFTLNSLRVCLTFSSQILFFFFSCSRGISFLACLSSFFPTPTPLRSAD